jgi:5'-deoxynucleotidase YfbR-like HD superfamily hydrolase
MAILHDLPEIHVSDVNHKVKRACPAIAKAVSKAESAFMARSVPERLAAQYSHLSSGTLEAAAVHVADTMSVVQYLRNEVAFGNSYMVPILKDAELRLAEVCTDFGTLIRASENE